MNYIIQNRKNLSELKLPTGFLFAQNHQSKALKKSLKNKLINAALIAWIEVRLSFEPLSLSLFLTCKLPEPVFLKFYIFK
jgi:hypothetical protein